MTLDAPNRDAFSEKEFYLAEFRGRSIGLVLAPGSGSAQSELEPVLADLARNGTRSVLIGDEAALLERACGKAVVDAADPRWIGALWHALRSADRVGLCAAPGQALAACARNAALRLRLAKLVWLDPRGGLVRPGGGRLSYVDRSELDAAVSADPARADLLREIGAMVDGGVPSAAICEPGALADELFTYAGAGTFFTRERYIDVRALGLDEFDAAHDLIRRGVDEGYLMARTSEQLEEVLTNGFGVFVERRYLAGLGALIPHPASNAGELGSLYTLTRFAGEGIGGHLVRYAIQDAVEQGFDFVYACTTQQRVVDFFENNGFAQVEASRIPEEKWNDYPGDRRELVTCLRKDLR